MAERARAPLGENATVVEIDFEGEGLLEGVERAAGAYAVDEVVEVARRLELELGLVFAMHEEDSTLYRQAGVKPGVQLRPVSVA